MKRQRRWQIKMASEGRCPKCGNRDTGGFKMCRSCRLKESLRYHRNKERKRDEPNEED